MGSLLFSIPVVLWAAWPFFVRGWKSLVSAQPEHVYANRSRTASPSHTASWRSSSRPLSGGVPRGLGRSRLVLRGGRGHLGAGAAGRGSAAARAENTSGAIRALLKLAPATAIRLRSDGNDDEVPLDQVRRGDR